LRTAAGEEFQARYLVDGSGHKSLVAQKFGLREGAPELRTQSRTIFTHMKGFRRYDDTLRPDEQLGLSRGWYEGTLHHMIDGGWFWIIRFDNVPGSESDLTSVGLTLDMRKYPERGIPPEQEFNEIVARFPSIATHLEGGVAVRPWVGTGRLQFSARDSAGPRCFLMSHANGFIDALYSRGMINTFEQIHALAPRLMQALRDDDFSPERFDYPRRLQSAMIMDNDRMVFNSFRAFATFPTWNAWLRLWLMNIIFGDLRMFRICLKFLMTGDKAVFESLDADPLPLSTAPGESLVEDLYRHGDETFDRWEAGEITAEEASAAIFQNLGESNLPPIHPWSDPAACHLDFLPEKLGQMIGWGMTAASPDIARMFDFDPSVLAKLAPQPEPVPEPEAVPAMAYPASFRHLLEASRPPRTRGGRFFFRDLPPLSVRDAASIATTAKTIATAAKAMATAAKALATTAKTMATAAKTLAMTAKAIATTAKTLAAAAKTTAMAAKTLATAAKTIAMTATAIAMAAKAGATTAKAIAMTAKTLATAAKTIATTAQAEEVATPASARA